MSQKVKKKRGQKSNGAESKGKANEGDRVDKDSITAEKQEFEFRDFFWDEIIRYASSAMVALTLLDILAHFLGDTVHCMTPSNFTRDQGAFINSYCSQFTPPTDYFPFYLVVQVTLIYGVHFLWYSWFSGKFRYFLALASSLERHRESKSGNYSLYNFVTTRALLDTFENSASVFLFYISKLILQLLVAAFSIYFSFDTRIFGNYDASFDCPDVRDFPTAWSLGNPRITCVLTSLIVLKAVQWINCVLLVWISLVTLYALFWCVWDHKSRLNWLLVAKFCFESGLPPSSYVPKKYTLRYFKKRYFCKYRIKSDFDFLLLKLYREDAGHAHVLWEVLVDEYVKKDEQRQIERLSLWRKLGKKSLVLVKEFKEKSDQQNTSKRRLPLNDFVIRAKENEDLGNSLQAILCNLLTAEKLGLEYIDALDIAFGTSGYKIQLASKSDRVVAVDMNPYYLNAEEAVCANDYAADISSRKTFSNVFAEDKSVINKFRDELAKAYYTTDPLPEDFDDPLNTGSATRANVVVVGPIPAAGNKSADKDSRVISVHWLVKWMRDYKLLDPISYLITVRPMAVEGNKAIGKDFVEFIPTWTGLSSPLSVFKRNGHNVMSCRTVDGFVRIRCGWSNCDFVIKVYSIPQLLFGGPTDDVEINISN